MKFSPFLLLAVIAIISLMTPSCTLSGEFDATDAITAVRFTFSNASNQIGIESLSVKYKLVQ